ncbi:MAG: ATP-dependent zinc metalloprotease FtsH [Kiritimatiellae bacterium]|nr:ATP-dependent zinc metalloprotease FtsH [Kiritimatiellia bacterium]
MEKKSANPLRSWLVIALIVLAFLSLYRLNPNEAKVAELTRIEFFKALDEGRIVEPVIRFLDRDELTTFLTGEMRAEQPGEDGGEARARYRVPLIPGENEKIMEDLFARNVKVLVKEKKNPISPFVVQTLFFVGMLALMYWLFARRVGGGDGVFGVGKSRARLVNGNNDGKRKVTFADVAGIDEAKEEVQEVVEFLKHPDDFRKLGGKIPKGVLLVGPPGTGKTLLAKAIAGEAEVPFFAISGSDFEEMFVGVGASRMRDMFAEAKKKAPCIVFIDEIDSIGQKRNTAALPGGRYNEQTLNTMLVEMDGFADNEGVIVIAATNRPDTLDAALLRPGRFDRQVHVELPTLKGREQILALHGKRIKFGPDADLGRVARGTPGFSGADLANLLNEAALMATRKKLDGVDMKTLEEARDKVLWGRERKSAGYSQKDREITAWHEAGHAILQLLSKNADPLHKVTIIPRGRALGVTMSLPERDVLNRSRSYFLDELVICCGGRIAEKMFTGDISTGAAQDIRQATEIARQMVCVYGMCDRFGFQSFVEPTQFSAAELPPAMSDETARAVDAEVSRLVGEAYAKAERLIAENRGRVELLAKTLLERETIDGREVESLVFPEKTDAGKPGVGEGSPAQ